MSDRIVIQDIPSLLHDARLLRLHWEPKLRSLRMYFSCLMRNVARSTIHGPVVELRLDGVERIAGYYSPANVEIRPAEFINDSPLTVADLDEWKRKPCEVYLSINSANDDFRMGTSCELDWLFGEASGNATNNETAFGIHLAFEVSSHGQQAVATGLYVESAALQPMMSGMPLSVHDWRQLFDAWWQGWQDYWARQYSKHSDDNQHPILEDRFIPAGADPSPDLTYRPPAKLAFQLETTDTPAELLSPIKDFHSGLLEHDWQRMALAYPNFDKSTSDRAEELSNLYLSHEFGRWVYVRAVDSWWAEGVRACVIVRGIEHVMPAEGELATNNETVITYGLLKYGDAWIISTWSQRWSQDGSVPQLRGQQSWRDGWDLAE